MKYLDYIFIGNKCQVGENKFYGKRLLYTHLTSMIYLFTVTKSCFLLLAVLCFFLSCEKQKKAAMQRSSSLRDEAAILESRLTWEKELHPEEAQEKAAKAKIARTVPISPDSLLAVKGTEKQKIYPELRGFARLDTSAYNAAQLAAVKGFCTALIKKQNEESFFMRGCLWTLSLFRYNLEAMGKKTGNISSYLLGEPFINENECQCPVRLTFTDKTTADIFIYLVKTSQDWKINQIACKEGAADGKK